MARVEEFVAVGAPRERVLSLITDLGRRHQFLPPGWRVIRPPAGRSAGVGASLEVEWRIGPAATPQVIQILEVTETSVLEGPPAGDNYLTNWELSQHGSATLVVTSMQFSYGDIISEWFVRRRLRKALKEMLTRLKTLAEREGEVRPTK